MVSVHCTSLLQRASVLSRYGAVLLTLLAASVAAAQTPSATRRTIETRAACITHEGGDLPATRSGTTTGTAMPQPCCLASELDGTVCEALDEVAARPCRAREIAIWDGVLDRLLGAIAGGRRLSPTKGAIAVFRTYRDRTCAAYRAIAVNPSDPGTVEACRLSETARFTQRIYEAAYSP